MIKESLERKGNGPMSEKKLEKNTLSHSLHEECGVFGMYDLDGNDVASTIYYGLFALQHRGQESCGIAVSDTCGPKGKVTVHKDMGLVNEVFTQDILDSMKGDIGVGHVRYSTAGASTRENAQPLVLNYVKGTLGLAHNGNLINANDLRKELEYTGAIFQTTIDSEVIAYHIARERLNSKTVEEAVKLAAEEDQGSLCPCSDESAQTNRGKGPVWIQAPLYRKEGQRLYSGLGNLCFGHSGSRVCQGRIAGGGRHNHPGKRNRIGHLSLSSKRAGGAVYF